MDATERKGTPFSIRLAESTERLIDAEARRTKRSKSAVVESLTEEGARVRRFPGIGFHGDDFTRTAWLIGTGLDVWEVIEMLEDLGPPARLQRESELNERQIQLAVAYHRDYPVEIDEAIAENRRPAPEWSSLFPFVQTASTG